MLRGTLQTLPLDLVTGFLGSGKTTLINAVLRDPAFAGAMVIVNEFGEIGLDHLIVTESQDNVLLLESGCLCCAASGTLRDTLIDLFSRRATGAVAPFGRIVVETSGLANPGPIVASLIGDSALLPRCHLQQVITLVDAVHGAATLDRYREAERQIAFADRILVTKTDLACAEDIAAVEARIRTVNAQALLHTGTGSLATAAWFTAPPVRSGVPADPAAWVRGPLRPGYAAAAGEATHGAAYGAVATFTFRVPGAIAWSCYAAWCDAMRRRFGARLLRCKGLLMLGPERRTYIVQGVQGFFAPPTPYAGTHEESFVVCIGEGLDRTELESLLALLAPEHSLQETPS